jgi:hypothetical protein
MIPPLWVLAAAAAVAYLLLSRPAAPAGLPPLVPVPLSPATRPGESLGPPILPAPTVHPATILAILAAGGMIAFAIRESRTPTPAPGPTPAVGLDLRGKFIGPEAAADAATTAAITGELSKIIVFDRKQAEPRLKTGASFDDLRKYARALRTRGVSLGDRQPAVRDAIKAYLDAEVGTDGGPVDDAAAEKWAKAYATVSAAAEAATK